MVDLTALLDLYEVGGARARDLLELNRRTLKRRMWWRKYTKVLHRSLRQLLTYEAQCRMLLQYEPSVVPGLLQTEDYARAVLGQYADDPRVLEALVDLRMQRRDELRGRERPPRAEFLIDEAALWRRVGGNDQADDEVARQKEAARVMADQMDYLVQAADVRGVTVGVVPFEAGAHPGILGSMALYELGEDHGGEVLLLETRSGGSFVRDPAALEEARGAFTELRRLASKDSVQRMENMAARYRAQAEGAVDGQ